MSAFGVLDAVTTMHAEDTARTPWDLGAAQDAVAAWTPPAGGPDTVLPSERLRTRPRHP